MLDTTCEDNHVACKHSQKRPSCPARACAHDPALHKCNPEATNLPKRTRAQWQTPRFSRQANARPRRGQKRTHRRHSRARTHNCRRQHRARHRLKQQRTRHHNTSSEPTMPAHRVTGGGTNVELLATVRPSWRKSPAQANTPATVTRCATTGIPAANSTRMTECQTHNHNRTHGKTPNARRTHPTARDARDSSQAAQPLAPLLESRPRSRGYTLHHCTCRAVVM